MFWLVPTVVADPRCMKRDGPRPRPKEAAEKLGILVENVEKGPSAAEADIDSAGFTRGLKPPSPSDVSFSAACEVAP